MRYFRLYPLIFVLLSTPLSVRGAQANPWQHLKEAFVLERDGKPAQAIVALQALVTSESVDAVIVGKSFDILGLAYEDLGDLTHAQHAFEQAMAIFKAIPDHATDYAIAVDNLGGLYMAMGRVDTSLKLKLHALRLYENAGDHGGIAISCSDLTGLALLKGKPHDAEKYLAHAQQEELLASDLDADGRAAISSRQGWLAKIEGRTAESVAAYQRALELWKSQHGEEHPFTGWGLMLLGDAIADAESASARDDMERGLAIIARTLGRNNPRYLAGQIAYSRVLDRTGAHTQATRLKADAERRLQDLYHDRCLGCTISVAAFR